MDEDGEGDNRVKWTFIGNETPTIYRIVVIAATGDFDESWKEVKLSSDKCDEDPSNHGFDCFDYLQATDRLETRTENNEVVEDLCSLLIFVDYGTDCSDDYTLTEDTSKRPPNLQYTINDPASETDVTGLFTEDDSGYSICWRYELEFVSPTSLAASDSSAITFDCTNHVTVAST